MGAALTVAVANVCTVSTVAVWVIKTDCTNTEALKCEITFFSVFSTLRGNTTSRDILQ